MPVSGLLGDGTALTTAVTLNAVDAVILESAALKELCNDRPDIAAALYQAIAEIIGRRYALMLGRVSELLARGVNVVELLALA